MLLASVSFLLLHQRAAASAAAAVVVAIVVGALVTAMVDSYPGYVAIIANLQTPLFIQGIRLYAPFDKADILVCPGAQLRDFGFRPGFRV